MRKAWGTLVILLLCGRAHAQRTGEFDGWAADGRAVVTMLGQDILCEPAPASAAPLEPLMETGEKGQTCVRCEDQPKGACAIKQKSGANGKGKLPAARNDCPKDGTECTFDLKVAGGIHHTYGNTGEIKVFVAGAWTRADGKAVAVHIRDDQPGNHVAEDAIWIVDLGDEACAGPDTADSPAGLVNAPGAAARGEVVKGDLDGDGNDDAIFVARPKSAADPFIAVAAVRKGARWVKAACLARSLGSCPSGSGDAAVRGKVDGKHPIVEIAIGCSRAQDSVVWMWVGNRLRQVFEFASSDAKGIERTIELADVDDDGVMEIVVTGRKGKETYDPRVTRFDAKAGEFKNDKALSEKVKAERAARKP